MTRTSKWQFHESQSDPKWFSQHHGYLNQNPSKVKKQGAGKGNWGAPGSEIEDLIDLGEIPPVFNKSRRGSNISAHEKRYVQLEDEFDAISDSEEEAEYENEAHDGKTQVE